MLWQHVECYKVSLKNENTNQSWTLVSDIHSFFLFSFRIILIQLKTYDIKFTWHHSDKNMFRCTGCIKRSHVQYKWRTESVATCNSLWSSFKYVFCHKTTKSNTIRISKVILFRSSSVLISNRFILVSVIPQKKSMC